MPKLLYFCDKGSNDKISVNSNVPSYQINLYKDIS